jgi:hypothetical protein
MDRRVSTWLVVPAALLLVGVLLMLPGPDRQPQPSRAVASASTSPGLPLLSTVWPGTRPVPVPRLADGSAVKPLLATSTAIVGVVDSPDLTRTTLITIAGGRDTMLQTAVGGLFQGIALVGDRLFWMLTSPATGTAASVGLWSAPIAGGTPVLVTADVGLPLLPGPGYTLQVHTGRLYWTSLPAAADETGGPPTGPTQIRSIPVSGGAVQVHSIPGVWAVSAWPWLVTAPDIAPLPGRYNLDHNTADPIVLPAGYRQVACGPAWCLASGDTGVELLRPDGTDPRPAGPAGTRPVTDTITVQDRYVPLLQPVAATQRLVLDDLTARRLVLVAPAVTDATTDGQHLWWSTGDHETLTWSGLDLTELH